jgi:hypothetical protein
MDETIHQIDPVFKGVFLFFGMTVTKTQTDIILKCPLSQLPTQDNTDFCDNALYVMPTWARTIPVIVVDDSSISRVVEILQCFAKPAVLLDYSLEVR